MNRKPYPQYKASGVEWLGDVPEHWEVKRLKTSANCIVSNVDKVPDENELPVRLCNYTDVYYNDFITPNMDLMETTATAQEIQKFKLETEDVIITKDSEEWNDIAVSALVKETAADIVCGYHLALIRPKSNKLSGQFLHRLFHANEVNHQFQIAATGVTRYGLPKSAIGEALIPLPPLSEQQAIAAYLDRETGRIDTLVAKKKRLVELLREKRTALISRAVTKGLDLTVKMKPSGIEWLGDVPAHWEVKPLRYLFENLDSKRIPLSSEERGGLEKIYPYYGASGIIDYVDNYIFDNTLILIAEDGANLLSRSTPLAFRAEGKYWVNNHAHILKPKYDAPTYWESLLQIFNYTPYVS
ncbi:MAG: restriction endonuclease subunit S, partial [Acidobacteria bacterium]|nr:restriction endonuclease subunit S [Acidobacteriota bacterium]